MNAKGRKARAEAPKRKQQPQKQKQQQKSSTTRIGQAVRNIRKSCGQTGPTYGKSRGYGNIREDIFWRGGVRRRAGTRKGLSGGNRNNRKFGRNVVKRSAKPSTIRTNNIKNMVSDLHSGARDGVSITNRWEQEGNLHLISGIAEDNKHNATLITGAEFLTSVDAFTPVSPNARGTGKGEILLSIPLQPRLLLGTRFEKMSEMYQNYEIVEMAITLIPVVPSIQAGSTIGFINYDPDFDINQNAPGATLLKQALNFEGAENSNVYNAYTMVWKPSFAKQSLFLDPEGSDPRLTTPGMFYLISGSNFPTIGSETSITLYNVWFSYKCLFFDRAIIEPPAIQDQLLFDLSTAIDNVFIYGGPGPFLDWAGKPVVIRDTFFGVAYQIPGNIYQMYVIGSEQLVAGGTESGWAYGLGGVEDQLVQFQTQDKIANVSRGTFYYVRWEEPDEIMDPDSPAAFYVYSSLRALMLDDKDVFHTQDYGIGQMLLAGILTPLSY